MPPDRQAMTDSTRLDGVELLAMVSMATRLFERNIETVNALNVFPVPDGDTGTNMFLTLRDVVAEAEKVDTASAGEVAGAMARGALMGARGNSGVILSQVFKGLALELDGRSDLDANHLAHALSRARTLAYKAVGHPVEGTMLTVIGAAADASNAVAGGTVRDVVDAACEAAREAVAMTPTMLPVLRDAGVVDAGGQGFLVILEGVLRHVAGGEAVIEQIPVPDPVGVAAAGGAVSQEFLDTTDDEVYGYCIQFTLGGSGLDPDAVRDRMAESAESAVVVGMEETLKVHVHAAEPDLVMDLARSIGAVSDATVTDMDEQHRRFSAVRRSAAEGGGAAQEISVVAVVWGDGNEEIFRDLGVVDVVRPVDVLNPSVSEISQAIEAVGSESVIVLPNNSNVAPAALQAADLSGRKVKIVPTKTMPQGVAAMLAFDDARDVHQNVAAMEGVLSSVRTGEVCLAERAAKFNGRSVARGQVIGLLDRELVAAGEEPTQVVVSLLQASNASRGDLVTMYWGSPITAEDAAVAQNRVQEQFPGTEIELVRGGQPSYHYIVSIE